MQGDTVYLICWRRYGTTANVTEAVYEANPGLADLGPILPHGHLITLPPIQQVAPVNTELALWD